MHRLHFKQIATEKKQSDILLLEYALLITHDEYASALLPTRTSSA